MRQSLLRKTALCLLTTLLLSFFAACSFLPFDDHTATEAATDGSAAQTTTLATLAPAETPVNLNGYTWSMRVRWSKKILPGSDESESAQRLRDIYAELEELYHIDIIVGTFGSTEDYLATFASGAKYADVIGIKGVEIPTLVAQQSIYSVEDPAILNAGLNCNDRTRFWPYASSQMRYADKQWTLQISSRYDIPSAGYFVLCNGSLLDALGAGNLHNLLKTGKWTLEQYQRLATAAASLTKRENVYGTGLSSYRSAYHALGGLVVSADGRWKSELSAPTSVSAIERLSSLISPDNHALIGPYESIRTAFLEDQLLFLWASAKTLISDSEFTALPDLVVMPVPAIGQTRTTPLTDYTGYAFPAENPTLANSVAVFNALALRLNEDWLTQVAQSARLDETETAMIATYVLPTLQASAEDYNQRLTSFFDESIASPLVSRADRPEAILKSAEPILAGILKELPAPTLGGR